MKLQAKLTISLLAVGLVAVCTVGGVSYWLIMRGFAQSAMEQAFSNFRSDMTAYIETYGGWEVAVEREPFGNFVRRRREPPGGPDHRPERPADDMIDRRGPPFRFIVMDATGRVRNHAGPYEVGSMAPAELRDKAVPIYYQGRVEVIASPLGEANLTERDRSYLNAMLRALLIGGGAALSLALLLGFVVGRGMGGALRKLTAATQAMLANRELPYRVEIDTKDEIGELANAFNLMNAELVYSHRELRELTVRDALTNLFNRRYFDEQAEKLYQQTERYGRPLTIMVGDLDYFKRINDNYSHAVGDKVLCTVAKILAASTRKSDIVARYGGEEFVILFPETSLEQAVGCCEELRRRIEAHPWTQLHPELKVTMSMGLCDKTELGNVEAMLAEADTRLYEAKRAGRNCIMPRLTLKTGT